MERETTDPQIPLSSESGQYWLTHFDLANWGIENVAYVKPIDKNESEDGNSYGIFAADGTELAQMGNRDEAIITIRQNDLQALSVH